VTARLSKHFYDQLGDDVANELVNWFNAVDETYRGDLRALNETNFARFDAKLEQRFAERDARFEARFAQIEVALARQGATIERALKEQTRWMFVAWASMMLTIVGFGIRG
jgi:hypothetical protein